MISVIVFGDSAYTLLPLTDDQALTRRMLARIRTTMAGRFNALGEAITLAVKEADKNPQRRRILVLFTDADSSTDNLSPTAAAELARAIQHATVRVDQHPRAAVLRLDTGAAPNARQNGIVGVVLHALEEI